MLFWLTQKCEKKWLQPVKRYCIDHRGSRFYGFSLTDEDLWTKVSQIIRLLSWLCRKNWIKQQNTSSDVLWCSHLCKLKSAVRVSLILTCEACGNSMSMPSFPFNSTEGSESFLRLFFMLVFYLHLTKIQTTLGLARLLGGIEDLVIPYFT